jgi:hypothetical protein
MVKVSSLPDNPQIIFTISTTIVPVPKISYQLKLAPKSELKKQPHKRKNQVRILTLSADLDWDTVKAQILAKIDDCLKPMTLSFDDYELCFTVPRKVSDPAPLATVDDYSFLLKNVVKCMDKTAYIYICAIKVRFSDVPLVFLLLYTALTFFKDPTIMKPASVKGGGKENRDNKEDSSGSSSGSDSSASGSESNSVSGEKSKKRKRKEKRSKKEKSKKGTGKPAKKEKVNFNNIFNIY